MARPVLRTTARGKQGPRGPEGERGPQGDQGPQGERGLPGVNAVPADEAVGTYLETEESESRAGARAAVAADVATPGNPIHSALTGEIEAAQSGLGFAPARDLSIAAPSSANPEPLDVIDGVLYGAQGNVLYRSTDEGQSWSAVRDFATVTNGGTDRFVGIRPLNNGEVLVIKSGALFTSSGWATNPATATFTRRLVPDAPSWFEPFSVDTDPATGRVVATSYVASVPDFTTSRYVWLSTNNGQAFSVIWDMATDHAAVLNVSHMHLVKFDPYEGNRIYVSYHNTVDPPSLRRVMYTDNDGGSWTTVVNNTHMPTVAVALPMGMLFGSDETPDSLYRIVRGGSTFERFYTLRRDTNQGFGWAAKAVVDETGVAHFLWTAPTSGQPIGVVSTDGYSASETITLPTEGGGDNLSGRHLAVTETRILGSFSHSSDASVDVFKADRPKRGPDAGDPGGMSGGAASVGGVAVGLKATAAEAGTVLGVGASTTLDGVAIGYAATATGTSTVVGRGATATLTGCTVVGRNASSPGASGTVFGSGATITNTQGVAIGALASAHTNAASVGYNARATATGSVALGKDALASNGSSVAIGQGAVADSFQSVALGNGTDTSADNQVQIGARHIELLELAADVPALPDQTRARLYVKDDGAGKTQLCVRFGTGTPIVIATQA